MNLREILVIGGSLVTFATSAFAIDYSKATDLDPASVEKMSCNDAVKQLKARVELSGQLGNSFLQVYEELENVYTIWGDKLSKQSDINDISNIAKSFQQSADTVKEGRNQSAKAIEELKIETALLMSRVENCVAH